MYLITMAFLLLSASLFGQKPLGITQYPAIKYDGKPVEYSWGSIKQLIEDGQPNAASLEIEKLQKRAISERNVSEYWHTMEMLDRNFLRNYSEETDEEKWIWRYSEKADSLPFPMNNIAHFYLSSWVQSSVVQANDESLDWKMGKERVRIGEQGTKALADYHLKRSLDNPEELMRWGILFAMYPLDPEEYSDEKSWESVFKSTPPACHQSPPPPPDHWRCGSRA